MKRIIFVGILMAWILGCGSYFAPDRNVKETLVEQDVYGTWALTGQSLNLLIRDKFVHNPGRTYTITFHPDGNFQYESVETTDWPVAAIGRSASGQWSLIHDSSGDSNIVKKNVLVLNMNNDPNLPSGMTLMHLNFARKNGRLVLWRFYGDPDSWEFMEYEQPQPSISQSSKQ